ncbi:MAG: Nif3-like dinuclear metal center hexameric protein [Saprospiraceae bacterium]|nr:Nif3-like dinuclear metal center hexameric protein [Saprospiraceae bacterium]
MIKIKEILQHLESIAPPTYQESYDNAGLIVGDKETEVTGVLTCLDSTEAVIEEAIAQNCNLVVAHHPIVFRGLKKITGKNYVERVIIKAIQHKIAIYAIHTNLDNVYYKGVNAKIGEKIGLENTQILAPKAVLKGFIAYTFDDRTLQLYDELKAAGVIALHQQGHRLEGQFEKGIQSKVVRILEAAEAHSSITDIENKATNVGSGLFGTLPEPMSEESFLTHLKQAMQLDCIRYTALRGKTIQKVALCGGAGGFLLKQAIRKKADIFITADYKYHEFFDADQNIIIADIGHFESEQFTIDLLAEIISDKFSNFAVRCTSVRTNPIHYWC